MTYNTDTLPKVCEIERAREWYQFDLFGVFYSEADRTYWVATDSGCSCPIPWEDVKLTTELDDEGDHLPTSNGPFTYTQALRRMDLMSARSPKNDQGWFVDDVMAARNALREHAVANGLFPQ